MGIFRTDQSLEEMLEKMNNNQGVTETIHAGAVFINYKLQQELLDSQKEYNKKQLFWSRVLAISTIALVFATALLVKFE
jgi:hydrogenase maturation factor HypF (carbamoyltransferase family)